jgi:protoporphyrinogen oxidase
LYELDFGPYTEKFTRLPNELIHPDWAKAGINRAVIKEDIKMNSLLDIIKTALKPKPNVFILYPQNGISEFHDRLKESIIQGGGKILVNCNIASFTVDNQIIKELKLIPDLSSRIFDTVVWTAPIGEINTLLSVEKRDLKYLNIIIYNVCVKGKPRTDYQWIYYVDETISFNRLYNTVLFSRKSAPEGYYGLCIEVTCYEDDEIWKNPSLMKSRVIDDLIEVKLIRSRDEVIDIFYEKLDKAYPVYKTNYRRELKQNLDDLGQIKNLIMAGRTGLFWYNNMDHSIENAFKVVDCIIQGKRETETIKDWDQ